MKRYYVLTTEIDYYVGYEDVDDGKYEYSDDELNRRIALVKSTLPQQLELEITCEPEDLDDQVADAISNETNWLINCCNYKILSEVQL